MANVSFLPSREPELVTWIQNFDSRINLTPLVFGLSAAQASTFSTYASAFIAAYDLCNSDATNSRSATQTKKTAKLAVVANARQLSGIIQKFPGTTDTMRSELGLTVPAQRVPAPIPTISPVIRVKSSNNHVVELELLDPTDNRRARPAKVACMYVFSWIGTTNPPADITQWSWQGSVTKNPVRVAFSPDTPANAQVWFTSAFVNTRQQPGPLSAPITTNIAGGVSGAETTMKMAA